MKIEAGTASTIMSLDTHPKKALPAATNTQPPLKKGDEPFNVEISSASDQFSTPQNPDEISHDRVAAIRDQLAAGTYNISGKDVAQKILGVLK